MNRIISFFILLVLPAFALAAEKAAKKDYLAFTYLNPNGNRFIEGQSSFPNIQPLEFDTKGKPAWIVGAPFKNGTLWTAILEDGKVVSFQIKEGKTLPYSFDPKSIPSGTPPLLRIHDGTPSLLAMPAEEGSTLTHPVLLPFQKDMLVFVKPNGMLAIQAKHQAALVAANALPDTRLLYSKSGEVLVLAGPTERYPHGIMGDEVEASMIRIVDTNTRTSLKNTILLPESEVVESLIPIWMDWNGDNRKEIILTLSDENEGSYFAVLDRSGKQLAYGPTIGTANRWRHQIAVAPFGPNKEMELVGVRTPHIGGIVEFYQWNGKFLKVVASLPGYSSHEIGSRNLDMASVADFNGDGTPELLVPTQNLRSLAGIQRTDKGAAEIWKVALNAKLATNVAVVKLPDGKVAVGVATTDGKVKIWVP